MMGISVPKIDSCKQKENPLTDNTKKRKWADAQFKKAERATEGAKATSEYDAEREAERVKTVRLKAQREAKEAADKVATQTAPAKKKR